MNTTKPQACRIQTPAAITKLSRSALCGLPARAWLVSSPGVALYEALRELLASEYGRPDWLLAYWSKSVLFSVAARKAWVEPDLQQLPF